MSFSSLPREIVHEVLVAAVKVRGLKRATRLRYVDRFWNVAVMEAIFASGILDDYSYISSFWPRYLAYRVLSKPASLSKPLRVIRQVAERLVSYRSDATDYDEDAVRECVTEICEIPCHMYSNLSMLDAQLTDQNTPAEDLDLDDEQFKQTLMSAAAWTNELALVQELLPSFENCRYLLCQDGHSEQRTK